ncbi:MAG: hypothetical protein N3F05_02600 [Candidatus Diapherotrites archaeon]|nr:hypothetical protein [Candidatus Diapherotrites archaeon]
MALLSWLQIKIAKELIESPMSLQELSKAIGENPLDIEKALKDMVALKLVTEKSDMFYISEEIKKELLNKRELTQQEKPKTEIQAYIEVKGLNKKAALKQMKEIEKAIKAQNAFVLYSSNIIEPEKQGDFYIGHLDITIGFKSLTSLVQFMYLYGPSVVEVIKPPKAEFTAFDLQEALNQMAEFIFKYNVYLEKNLRKADIERFYASLLQKQNF